LAAGKSRISADSRVKYLKKSVKLPGENSIFYYSLFTQLDTSYCTKSLYPYEYKQWQIILMMKERKMAF